MKLRTSNNSTEASRARVIVVGVLLLFAFESSAVANQIPYSGTVWLTPAPHVEASSPVGQDPTSSPDARKRRVADGSTALPTTNSPAASNVTPQSNAASPAASTSTEPNESKPRVASRRNRTRHATSSSPDNNTSSVEPAIDSPKTPSVWSPPTSSIVVPTPPVVANDFWTRVGARSLLHRVRNGWPWFLSVVVLACLGFVAVQLRSNHKKQKLAKYRRWSDEKIGPIETPVRSTDLVESDAGLTVHEAIADLVPVEVVEAEEKLNLEQDAFRKTTGELERRRLELAEARRKADEENRSLGEVMARIRADEEARHEVEEEMERLRLEAHARLEEERLRYEETRRHVMEEQQRVHMELSKLFAEEDERLKLLELEKQKADEELRRKVEQERRLKAEIDDLFRAGAQQRARIEAETKRRAEAELRLQERARLNEVEEKRSGVERPVDVETKPAIQSSSLASVSPELLERLNSGFAEERANAVRELAVLGGEESFRRISDAFDDESTDVRNAAARALYELDVDHAASYGRALKDGSQIRRRRIGASVASSGLAHDAIANLTAENRKQAYDAFSLLFLMAKAGELEPLITALEDYPDLEVRVAVVKLLALTGQAEVVPGFQSLLVDSSLPPELKTAINDAIYQFDNQPEKPISPIA